MPWVEIFLKINKHPGTFIPDTRVELNKCKDPNEAYKHFFETFISVYDNFFPKVKVRIKTKSLRSPWMTKGIAKSSKRKQNIYEKYLKSRTNETETAYR